MQIVDSQIHLWENATMAPHHRQIATYSVDDALQLLNDRQNASAALNSLLQKEMGDRKVADSDQAFRVR